MAEMWDAQGYIRISGWKQIAAYLGEEIEVVQGWAQERGLPLHRWADGSHGRIFAYVIDLDEWMQRQVLSGKLQPAHPPTCSSQTSRLDSAASDAPAESLVARGLPAHPNLSDARPDLASRPSPRRAQASIPPAQQGLADQRAGGSRGFLAAATAVFVLVFLAALQHSLTLLSPASARTVAAMVRPLPPPPASTSVASPFAVATKPPLPAPASRLKPGPSRHQPDRETAELYLEGRYSWESRTPAGLTLARVRFADAIRHDPHFAPAYAGLAESYFLLRQYGRMPDRTAFLKAGAAARKAVELDPQSCEAHRSLGFVLSFWAWDMQAAEREFQRAIALDPEDAEAHHWYATSLLSRGRYREALTQIDQARKLDPASSAIQANRGLILLLAGDQQRGFSALREVELSNPDFVMTHIYLAEQYLRLHLDTSFLEEEEITARLQKNPDLARATLAARRSLDRGGELAMLQTLARHASRQADHGGSAYHAATYAMLVGNRQAALRYLELSHDRHEASFLSVRNQADFASLRADPEFHTIRALADHHS